MIRLLFWVLLLPIRSIRWIARRLFLAVRGYNVLELDVHGTLPDRHGRGGALAALSGEPRGPALLDVLIALDRARRDPRVRAVRVRLGSLTSGLARANELREALARVRRAGKLVAVHVEEAGLTEYWTALGATEVVVPPSGALNVTGLASEVVFLKGIFDKLGVRAWLSARGKYKSARELFAEPHMSEANREMTEALVGDLYEQLVEAISESRSLDPAAVRAHLDQGPFLAEEARAAGLVDHLAYWDEFEENVDGRVGKPRSVSLSAYLSLSTGVASGRPTMIALVDVAGHIKSGRSVAGADGARATGSRSFTKAVDAVSEDPRVKAIVLRVDSPGGSALASDVMWRALDRAKENKPIVVSMANVAASGGYFISGIRGAHIVASPSTVTGSIGVLAGKFEARGLYDKLGIKKEMVTRGRRAGYLSDYRGFSEDEWQKLESDVDAHYKLFVEKMALGRDRSFDEIDAVAQGRVWTGRQASESGLVDELGGLVAAFSAVRRKLELREDAPLALTSTSVERRWFPLRLEWQVPRGFIPDVLARPFRLAEYYGSERVFTLLPFDIRFW